MTSLRYKSKYAGVEKYGLLFLAGLLLLSGCQGRVHYYTGELRMSEADLEAKYEMDREFCEQEAVDASLILGANLDNRRLHDFMESPWVCKTCNARIFRKKFKECLSRLEWRESQQGEDAPESFGWAQEMWDR